MKKLSLLILFVSLNSFAQSSFFVDRKGEKMIVDDKAWDIIVRDKRLSYKLPGKSWEKYIKFEDLDYALLGPFKLKSYKINKKKKVLFVMAETDGKILASLSVTTTMTNGNMSSSFTDYEVYVLDESDNVLSELHFRDSKNKGAADKRGQLTELVKLNFPNCKPLVDAVDAANTFDPLNLGILEFLDSPVYRSCN